MQSMISGDMRVIGRPSPKLLKALGVIADELHPAFDRAGLDSKGACILSALAARDFLRALGIIADVRPVTVLMVATQRGEVLHSLGIGTPEQKDDPNRWAGHLVATVPAERYLIDVALFPTIRPQWRGLMTGMLAVPAGATPRPPRAEGGLRQVTGIQLAEPAIDYSFEIAWLDNPHNNRWLRSPDMREPYRRAVAVDAMRTRWEAA